MKKIISLLIVFVFICANISFAEEKPLTERELLIYYDVNEEIQDSIDIDDSMEHDDEYYSLQEEKVQRKINQKYGTTNDELNDIMNRANEYVLTDWDKQLFAEVGKKLPSTDYTKEEKIRACKEVASEYGVSFYRVIFIYDKRMYEIESEAWGF
ncbi:hypothetical protein ACFL5Y_02175 [Candidatus Omnitrophota bacterium]